MPTDTDCFAVLIILLKCFMPLLIDKTSSHLFRFTPSPQIQPAALHDRGAARRLSLDHQEAVPSLQVDNTQIYRYLGLEAKVQFFFESHS